MANLVDLELLYNELKREENLIADFRIPNWDGKQSSIGLKEIRVYMDALKSLESYYVRLYNEANQGKEAHLTELVKNESGRDALLVLKNKFHNESIEDILTHKNDLQKIVRYDNKFVQKSNLVYKSPDEDGLFAAHFYAPRKNVFGLQLSTLWVNVAVLWAMTMLMVVSLQIELTTRVYAWLDGLRKK
jgi:hypothetical protein